MNFNLVWMIARYALIAVGSGLVAKGHIDEPGLQEIIGGIGAVGAAVWGVYTRKGTQAVANDVVDKKKLPTVSQATGAETHP